MTGGLSGDHAWHLGFEGLWNEGPVSVLAEFMRADVSAAASGRTRGYARRVLPAGRWGSPELVARFSHEDMDDSVVHGGTFDKTYLGFNWWATRRWKFGFGWGHTWLDRLDTKGVTDSAQTRIQWIY